MVELVATRTLPPPSMKSVIALTFNEPPNSKNRRGTFCYYIGVVVHLMKKKKKIYFNISVNQSSDTWNLIDHYR